MRKPAFHRPVAVLAAFLAPLCREAVACSSCMGSADAPVAPAINASMSLLLAILAVVAGLFIRFLIYLARRDGLPLDPSPAQGGDTADVTPS